MQSEIPGWKKGNLFDEQDKTHRALKCEADNIPRLLKEPSPCTSYDHVHFLHEEKVASAVQSNAPTKYNILANKRIVLAKQVVVHEHI